MQKTPNSEKDRRPFRQNTHTDVEKIPLLWYISETKTGAGLQQDVCKLWKVNHLKYMCISLNKNEKEKMRPVHEACQSDSECWKGSNDKVNRTVDMVTIKSFNFNSICSVIITRLKTRSSQKGSVRIQNRYR